MGISDILKKSVSKGLKSLETAKEVVNQASADRAEKRREEALEKMRLQREEKAERERAEKEAREAEIAAEKAERAEARAKLLAASCEKGDCLWNDHKFYFTCNSSTECQRKKVVSKKDWGEPFYDERFWPYMKRLELIEKAKKANIYHPDSYRDLAEDFIDEFIPIYSDYPDIKFRIEQSIQFNGGFTFANTFLYLMLDLKGIDLRDHFSKHDADFSTSILKRLAFREVPGCKMHLNYDFYRNPSLYQRSLEDFEFTVRTFEAVLDEEKLSEFFIDTSFISVDQLYDKNGNIKEAGRGGPEAGEYGDTIYNTIESWGGENGENDRGNMQ